MARNAIPSLRHHKPSGQGFVELNGKRLYLGVYGRDTTQQRYLATVAEWVANGRELQSAPEQLTVAELCLAYWHHAKQWYRRPDGRPTSALCETKLALRALRQLYGATTAATFGPRALRAIQGQYIQEGLCRSTINSRVAVIKRAFKWAAGREMVPASAWHALQAVEGLRQGRSDAKEPGKVLPVAEADVNAILGHLSPTVATMVMVQWLTGMRPGEVCTMAPKDIDQRADVWIYHPPHHKNAHRGHKREVPLGPKAQALLRPFLNRPMDQPLFSPAESEQWHRQRRTAKRRTPLGQGNGIGTNRVNAPKRRPSSMFNANAYRQAIERGCDKAGIPRWQPYQLRHAAATRLRAHFGLEVAALALGHSSAIITDAVYAERDNTRLIEVFANAG
jgi:integrase